MADDQLLDRDLALAADAARDGAGAEREEHRRRIRGVVGVGEHAADRGLVAHARARDDGKRSGERRPALAHERRQLHRAMRRHRPEPQLVPGLDVREAGHTAEAEERRREEQPLVDEDADERPAGDDGRVLPLGLQPERIVERLRREPLRVGTRLQGSRSARRAAARALAPAARGSARTSSGAGRRRARSCTCPPPPSAPAGRRSSR